MATANMGRKFYICATPQPDDLIVSEFAALTWVEVKYVGNIGETGTQENIISYDTMDTTVTQKQKGIANAGDPTVEVAYDADDDGQQAMRDAAETRMNYAFKFEFDDAPTLVGTPTIKYNRGIVAGPAEPNGGPEDFLLNVFTLGLNQKQITVPASATAP